MKRAFLVVLTLHLVTRSVLCCDDASSSAAATSGNGAATSTATATSGPSRRSCASDCMENYPNYEPICANNQETFYNYCLLKCENENREKQNLKPLYAKYESACLNVPCSCSNKKAPVCDEFDISYYNYCYFDCASRQSLADWHYPIQFKSIGYCKSDYCACPLVFDPVCASNGVTFGNLCLLQCENARRDDEENLPPLGHVKGECVPPSNQCTNVCKTQPYQPVCADNNVTYYNICYMVCASLKAQENGQKPINFKYFGKCYSNYCACPTVVDPVCASNGVTYGNLCLLQCENARRDDEENLPPLGHVKGECVPPTNYKCTNVCKTQPYQPVCADNNVTYNNICYMVCASLKAQENGQNPINFKHFGKCF